VEAGKVKSQRLLTTLETILDGKQWLVGNHLTLADILVAVYVSRGLEWVLDAKWRKLHPNIMKHFGAFAGQEAVKKVIPQFVLIDNETPNVNPHA
jgi:elongation factor 1-gamma